MKKKNLLLGVLLASAVFSLASCTKEKKPTETDKPTETSETPKTTTGETPKPTETGEKPTETSVAPVEKFTVTFNSNGGSDVAAIADVEAGSKISAPTAPTKEATDEFEYEFVGWFNEALDEEFDFENTTITDSITLYAKWNEVVKPQLIVNKAGLRQFYQIGDDIDLEGISFTLKTADGNETLGIEDVKLNIKEFDSSKLGEYTIYVTLKSNENYTTSYKVFVCEEDYSDYQAISTAKELNDFRYSLTAAGKYMLTNDIDLDGIELAATSVTLMGEFNGNGHTIANAIYRENASVKTGILTKYLGDGAVVTNVRFDNCVADQALETLGLISGMGSGNINISKVQFSGCSVTCNNYAGFILGRIDAAKTVLTMSEITCKNGCKSNVSNYGGTLIGDVDKADKNTRTVVNIFDCDLDIELTGSNQNGGFLSGRLRSNTNLNIKNVVIRSAVLPAATGLICGGGDNNATNSTVTVKNLYVASTNAQKLQSCALQTGTNPVTSFQITYTNSYMGNASLPGITDNTVNGVTYLTGVEETDANVAWLDDSLNLDFSAEGKWTLEENDQTKFRLVASSTNVKSADAVISKFKVTTANATLRFEKGTAFDATGLAVTGIYSDGVNLPLTLGVDYELDITAFNADAAGIYEIIITSKENPEVTATYTVEVVEQTGFIVDTQFAKLAYFVGDEINLKKLLVYSTWTDGKTLLSSKYTTNALELDLTTAGAKELIVSMPGFDDVVVRISVVDTKPVVVDNYAYINVDANANVTYAGEKVNGIETFNTINEAVEYLVSANLDADVNKVMYIAAGTYYEKITIPASLPNLKIIGESRENSIIEYDAVEDTVDPITGSKYVMNCATLHVEAEGFGLENITVNNSFDYKNLNTKFGNPQGFALTIAADGAVIDNVTLYGNQDTLFFKKGRVYLKDSTIMGNIDFIFGENNGIAFFDQCKIVAVGKSDKPQSNNGYVTAMKGDATAHPTYGYVFYKCELTDDGNVLDGAMSLGRPWGAGATVAYIECSFSAAYSTAAYGTGKSRWYDMSGNKPQDANFVEYGSTGDGAITEAVLGGSIITEEEAKAYTAANTLAAANGGVSWGGVVFDYETAYAILTAGKAKVDATEILVLDGATEVGDTYEVPKDDSNALTITTKEWNAKNKDITVEVGDPTIAKFENGRLYGLAVGETNVTFKLGSITKTVALSVIVTPSYTVTFDTAGGTEVTPQTVFRNKHAEKPEVSKEGAVFKGWFADAAYTIPYDFDTEIITEETTIYARFVDWTDIYKENAVIYFDGSLGDGVDTFTYDNTDQTAATYYGLTVSGKFVYRSANSDTQYNNNVEVSFNVEKYATITLTQKSAFAVTCTLDGEEVTPIIDGNNVIYETTKAGVFKIKNTAGGNKYVTSLSVIYPEVISETTKINFGSEGDYTTATVLDQSGATYGQIQAKCNQIKKDSVLVFYVEENATIHISGNWSVGYNINGTDVLTTNAGGENNNGLEFDYFVENGGKVVITSLHDNNYFYYISVTYPSKMTESTKIQFGTSGNAAGVIDGVTMSGVTNRDAGDAQIRNGKITLTLDKAATITIAGNWSVDYTINGTTVVQSKEVTGNEEDNANLNYTFEASAGTVEIVVGDTSKCYFYYIDVVME